MARMAIIRHILPTRYQVFNGFYRLILVTETRKSVLRGIRHHFCRQIIGMQIVSVLGQVLSVRGGVVDNAIDNIVEKNGGDTGVG